MAPRQRIVAKRARARTRPAAARRDTASVHARLWKVQLAKFQRMVREILPRNGFYAAKFAGHSTDPRRVQDLKAFRSLPFTTKQELLDDQAAQPPYGSNLTYPIERYCRLHQSSGTAGVPLRWLDTPESWNWFLRCWHTIYDTIGLEPSDRLFFPFSFGPFLGFWGAFEGAALLGNLCLPGGGMTTVARLRFMLENRATVLACTPTYALRLAEVAEEEGLDLAGSPVRAIIVAGEPGGSIPATRARIESSFGVRVFDHTGMTEIGALGIECVPNPGGVHLIETECIAEAIDPQSCEPAAPGEPGELVLTNLGRWGSPLIRYRTGDLVRVDQRPCTCGRPWTRLVGGILGRVDDMIIIRGNNLYPAAMEELMRGLPDVGEYRCTVKASGSMNALEVAVEPAAASRVSGAVLAQRVASAIQERFHFRAKVAAVTRGSLPRFEMKARRFVHTV